MLGKWLEMSLTFKIRHISASRAWADCPLHKGERPHVEIKLREPYEGRCYCWFCGKVWQLTKSEVEGLKKMAPEKKEIDIDIEEMYRSLWANETPEDLTKMDELALEWNVTREVLDELGIYWRGNCYYIPMYDRTSKLCGIQCRYLDGFKRCVEGSKLGLFISFMYGCDSIFITEGCSDLASLLDLGFNGIGRANCYSCIGLTCSLIEERYKPGTKLVLIADNDEPGLKGASQLIDTWNEMHDWPMELWVPPCKDLRETVKIKGKEYIKAALEELL